MKSAKGNFSEEFLAAQVAGSCRLAGMSVTQKEEQMIRGIIAGKIDAAEMRHQVIAYYKTTNDPPE
jgi:hypothetical protein